MKSLMKLINEGGPGSGPHATSGGSGNQPGYLKQKRDARDAASTAHHKSMMTKLGATNVDDYLSKAKAAGYSVPKKDEKRVRRLMKSTEATKPSLADKNVGIKTPYWFWGSDSYHKLLFKDKKHQNESTSEKPDDQSTKENDPKVETPPVSHDDGIFQMLAENPDMSASTFFNLLKSKGYKVGLPDGMKQEADTSSSQPSGVFAAKNNKKESTNSKSFGLKCKLKESSASDNGIGYTKFSTILIQEGMGNLNDAFYYTRSALESAIPIFEGKKIYADHPSETEEATRPERSVRDILGHFENVKITEGEQGQAMLIADCVTMREEPYRWARALMQHAVEYSDKYPDKDFVGLSINASGDAKEMPIEELMSSGVPESALQKLTKAQQEGIQSIRVVSNISDAVSVDLVTEAGAGGRVLEMLEQEKSMSKKTKTKESEAFGDDKKKPPVAAATKPAPGKPAAKPAATGKPTDDESTEEAGEVPADGATKADGHDDEAQDVALIKKLLKDYIGGEEEPTEEECAMAKEAYGSAKEMGMEGEEALKCAGYSMKMAKHMASKQTESETTESETEESETEESETVESETKESKAVIKLTAENSKLKESLLKHQIAEHTEKVLQESGLPRQATKSFRKLIETAKTIKEINDKLAVYKEAYSCAGGEASTGFNFTIQPEKIVESTKGSKGLNLSECLTK